MVCRRYRGKKSPENFQQAPVPGLVLMDIKLAGTMDGIETARQIRQRLPVLLIFLTADSTERTLERVRELEPEGYLTKPVMEKDLFAAIRTALAKKTGKER
jgi:CheY-like chemotaxis protein